nr:hypothetical protein GCM10020093_113480 [Planobispora longispora]
MLSAGHACVDVYQGAVAALVPFLVAERAYTYAAASGIVLAASLLSSVAQPLFGAVTDRWALPWLLPVSTLLGGLGIALSGLTDSYPLTLALAAVSGIGIAAYHPESARVARIAAGGSHTAMGWFSSAATSGSPPRRSWSPPSSPPAGCGSRRCWRCRLWPEACCTCPSCARWARRHARPAAARPGWDATTWRRSHGSRWPWPSGPSCSSA